MQDADVLIVGQGIAGTCLAFELMDRDLTVHILAEPLTLAASDVELAVINPVTGRRYAKSWRIESLLEAADDLYQLISDNLGADYLSTTEIAQLLPDDRIEEIWMMRSGDPDFMRFLDPVVYEKDFPGAGLRRVGIIRDVRNLRISELLRDTRAFFLSHSLLTTGTCAYEKIISSAGGVMYGENHYKHIVFCQGHQAATNPFFPGLELYPMKGEFLVCAIPGLGLTQHLKGSISLIPLGDDHYWCGSTYDRYESDPHPTPAAVQYFREELNKLGIHEFDIIRHGCGIRATTRDRKPYVGARGEHPQIHMITGLGTKGSSLAPYCAGILAEHIAGDVQIPREVDILRHTGS